MRTFNNPFGVCVIMTLSTFLLAGCVTTGGTKAENSTRTTAEGAGVGAVIGGLAGLLLSGGDKEKMKRYTALGAVIGGVAGGVVGNEVAKRKKAYATREALLEGETRRTAQFVAEIKKVNKSLRGDIAKYKVQIAQLKQKARKGYASNRQLQTKLAEVQGRKKQASKALASVNNELKIARAMYDEAKTIEARNAAVAKKELGKYNRQIAALERERNELERYEGELLAMGTAISS